MVDGLAFDDLNKKARITSRGFSGQIPVTVLNNRTTSWNTFGINLDRYGLGDPPAPNQTEQSNQLHAFPSGFINGPRDQGATTGQASNDMRKRKINHGIDNNQGRGEKTIYGIDAPSITHGYAKGAGKGIKPSSSPAGASGST